MKTCNKCGEEMKEVTTIAGKCIGSYTDGFGGIKNEYEKDTELCFCTNPKCPNYGLYQVPKEDMPN